MNEVPNWSLASTQARLVLDRILYLADSGLSAEEFRRMVVQMIKAIK
jgi:hypothetical protein